MKRIIELVSLEEKYKKEKEEIRLAAEKNRTELKKNHTKKSATLEEALNQKDVVIAEQVTMRVKEIQAEQKNMKKAEISFDMKAIQSAIISGLN